ncbi:polysaccharide deacetylase family protein [Sphingobium sp. MP9-4]|jgi:peptidoglycan/xylan/chitin deacetylase (PgdA/CDA1 family)|uniref:polysaccharide deacetylase family protein n=1 Tax=Sphingobium sp. MP9-4 TaxID=1761936 RepID=UPI001F0EC2BB|nr:polysaccharide deacetylase family protein [Sphingobium sp. MP9-4]
MSGEERDAAIRAALNRHKIKAGGFVAGKYVNDSLSKRVLSAWSNADHIIGNHGFSHSYFSGNNPDALVADIMKCEPLLSEYPSFRRLFRFPYLAEGKSREGRDRMRMLLKQREFANAHVTIDTSDWYIDKPAQSPTESRPIGSDRSLQALLPRPHLGTRQLL